jgi:hypothetical protein
MTVVLASIATVAVVTGAALWWHTTRDTAGRHQDPQTAVKSSSHPDGSTRKKHGDTTSKAPDSADTVPATTTTTTIPDSPFGVAVTSFLGDRTGTVTAALFNLETGDEYVLHPGVVEDEASIVKVDVMATLLSQQNDGSNPTSPGEQGLLSSMIEDSDNDSATALWDQVGGADAISAFNQQAGMTSTTPSSCVTCANFPWPGWGLTTTTASDQVKLLQQLVLPNSRLTAAQRTYGLDLMENIAPSEYWGVSDGIPSGVTVALKNGWLPLTGETDWQVNSIGWIKGAGRNYIVAVLTSGNPTEEYGIDTINDVSSMLWGELGSP